MTNPQPYRFGSNRTDIETSATTGATGLINPYPLTHHNGNGLCITTFYTTETTAVFSQTAVITGNCQHRLITVVHLFRQITLRLELPLLHYTCRLQQTVTQREETFTEKLLTGKRHFFCAFLTAFLVGFLADPGT